MFLDLSKEDYTNILSDPKKTLENKKKDIWEFAKQSRVFKSIKHTSVFDARQTNISEIELQQNLNNIIDLIFKK